MVPPSFFSLSPKVVSVDNFTFGPVAQPRSLGVMASIQMFPQSLMWFRWRFSEVCDTGIKDMKPALMNGVMLGLRVTHTGCDCPG